MSKRRLKFSPNLRRRMNTNRQKVEALRILSEINNNELVSVSEAAQSIPGGESCVVSANTGLHGPIGF